MKLSLEILHQIQILEIEKTRDYINNLKLYITIALLSLTIKMALLRTKAGFTKVCLRLRKGIKVEIEVKCEKGLHSSKR